MSNLQTSQAPKESSFEIESHKRDSDFICELSAAKTMTNMKLDSTSPIIAPFIGLNPKGNETSSTISALNPETKAELSLNELLETATKKISRKKDPEKEEEAARKELALKIKLGQIKTGRWTVKEHEQFLEGYAKYKRDWVNVSRYIPDRDITQVRSHAQKYLMRQGIGKDIPLESNIKANVIQNVAPPKIAEKKSEEVKDASKTNEEKPKEPNTCNNTAPRQEGVRRLQKVSIPVIAYQMPMRPTWVFQPTSMMTQRFVPMIPSYGYNPACRVMMQAPMFLAKN
jgi:SHAQKYF class myb-like DNA-binding protein